MSDTRRRVMNLVVRGRLTASDDDNGSGLQLLNHALLRDEAKSGVERFGQYGFTSVAPPGAETITLFVGGGRDHAVTIATEDRASRMAGNAAGEAALYSDEGDYLVLKRGNAVDLVTNTLTITADIEVIIKAPKITITGDVTLDGNLTCSKTITADTVNAPHGHVGGASRAEDQE